MGIAEVRATFGATVTMADPEASSEGLDYFWECKEDDYDYWWYEEPTSDFEFVSTHDHWTSHEEHVQFRVTVGGVTSDPIDLWVTTTAGNQDACPECGGVGEHMPSCSQYVCPECGGTGSEHTPECPSNPDSSNEGMA